MLDAVITVLFFKTNGILFSKYVSLKSFVLLFYENLHYNLNFRLKVSKAVKNLKVPVTAKIRVFEDIDKTVEYAKMIEKSGVSV